MRLTLQGPHDRTSATSRKGKTSRTGKGGRGNKAGRAKRAGRRWLRLGALALLVLGATGGGLWFWLSGTAQHLAVRAQAEGYALSARSGLRIEEVMLEGRERTAAEIVIQTLGLRRGDPILAFDPELARQRLEALPWIRSARVERRLPDTIHLLILERRPLALWQLRGRLSVIDHRGEVIPGIEAQRFAELPLVVGEDAPQHAAELLALLAREPDMAALVVSAVRVGGRRWNLQLKGGVDVRLPESAAGEAWTQLARIEREHGLLDRDVVLIDLRLPDRLVVRSSDGEMPARQISAPGEST